MSTSASLIDDLAGGRAPDLVPLSVDQYHRMIEAGILDEGEAVELIEGMLVRKLRGSGGGDALVHGPHHALVVARLQRLSSRIEPLGCHVRSQLPVTLSQVDEPEPDLAIVRGAPEDFTKRHPGRDEVLMVVEVADSSLNFDRTAKQRLYAAAGIPAYWIVDLPGDRVEVFEEPSPADRRYARIFQARRGEMVRLPAETGGLPLAVEELLPPQRE